MRVIRWMLKPDQKQRPNVEDLLNLPNVSIRLRERALKRNIEHMKKKNEEIEQRESEINKQEKDLNDREQALLEKENEIEQMERMIAEMQRTMQVVNASTVAGTEFYLCGNSGENDEDGVNIGSNEDNDEYIMGATAGSGGQAVIKPKQINKLALSNDSASKYNQGANNSSSNSTK